MFEIYGGAKTLKQWSKNEKLIVNELPLGSEVHFYNNPNEEDPLLTEVYDMTDESGKTIRVCDVPNILLMEANKIKARVPEKIKGLYGKMHTISIAREKYITVEPAEKPTDYVYEETELDYCCPGGGAGGVTSWNDLPDRPFGEPCLVEKIIFEGQVDCSNTYSDNIVEHTFALGEKYAVVIDGVSYSNLEVIEEYGHLIVGATEDNFTEELPFKIVNEIGTYDGIGRLRMAAMNANFYEVKIAQIVEAVTPIPTEMLPEQLRFGEEYKALAKEQTVSVTKGSPTMAPAQHGISEGTVYNITWDGESFDCVCQYVSVGLAVGNLSVYSVNEADTGEPFFIGYDDVNNTFAVFGESGEHTFSITQTTITPIDEKYLPESVKGVTVLNSLTPEKLFELPNGAYYLAAEADENEDLANTFAVQGPTDYSDCPVAGLMDVEHFDTVIGVTLHRWGVNVVFSKDDGGNVEWVESRGICAAAPVELAAGTAPTAEEFNALVWALRHAGVLVYNPL